MDSSTAEEIVQDTRRSHEKKLAVHLILGSILFQTTAFYLLDSNVTNTLSFNETLNWTSAHSSTAGNIFDGTKIVSLLIFAVIGDAKVTRARLIFIGFPLYLIGFTLMTLIVKGTTPICNIQTIISGNKTSIGDENCASVILGSLILTGIADGSVRSNLVAFGADQIPDTIITSRYLDKFVAIMHLASILEDLASIFILNRQDYLTFYVVATVMLFIGALLFMIGWKYYTQIKPYDSVLINCISVYKNAFQTWRQNRKEQQHTIERNPAHVDGLNALDTSDCQINHEIEDLRFLDYAKVVNNGKFLDRIVNDVKLFQTAIIIFLIILPYRLIPTQFSMILPGQAKYMSVTGPYERSITINLMLITAHVTFIIGILILNIFFYKYLRTRNRSLTIAIKFVISTCFGLITMCLTGSVEVLRQDYCPENKNECNTTMHISDLSIYTQMPPYIVIGFGEIFDLLATFEFACTIAPRSAKSLFMSLYFISRLIISYFIGTYMSYLSTTTSILDFSCQNSKSWGTYTYFYILAALQIIFIIIFIKCRKYYRIIT